MTLEKPPTTLGENQFESSPLFLINSLYREIEKYRKFQQPVFLLILKPVHKLRLDFHVKQKHKFTAESTILNVVRTTLKTVSEQLYGLLENCARNFVLLYGLYENHKSLFQPRKPCQLSLRMRASHYCFSSSKSVPPCYCTNLKKRAHCCCTKIYL